MKLLGSFDRLTENSNFSCSYEENEYAQCEGVFYIRENEDSQYEKNIKEMLGDTSSSSAYLALHKINEHFLQNKQKHHIPIIKMSCSNNSSITRILR